MIAIQMTPFLDKLIHPSQTGFMQNRNISSILRQIIDIMKHAEEEEIQGLLISIDFEKAFDRVEMSAERGALRLVNFSLFLIDMIDVLYNDFETCTTSMGFTSSWFKPTRSLHQGCPMSNVTFVCVVELLGQQICDNDDIKGITNDNIEYKSVQFADDMNLFSTFERSSLQTAISTLQTFEANTKLKLNYDNTNVFRIGSFKNTNAKIYTTKQLHWTNDEININQISINQILKCCIAIMPL